MLFVLCYPTLTGEAARHIEAFRRVHDPVRAALIPAHITLVFGVGSIGADDLTSRAAYIAAHNRPFDITLTHTEAYEDHPAEDCTLFLMVGSGGDQLTALHDQFHAGALSSGRNADVPFRPHITIATASSLEKLRSPQNDARQLSLPIAGRIDRLSIAALDGGNLSSVADLTLG